MRVCVVSREHRALELCREALSALTGRDWELRASAPEASLPEAELYVWDYEPQGDAGELPAMGSASGHILLVQRGHLRKLRKLLGGAQPWVILKPVNAATLRSFLEQAAKGVESARKIVSLREQRDQILDCLLEANLQLQEYDQQRTNFLARAVHDFRAPLTALNGYCGLLLGQQLGPLSTPQTEVLRRMQHSIRRLTRIATATLELSMGRLSALEPDWRQIDIQACIEQALHEIMPLAGEKNLAVSVNMEPAGHPLSADPFQIEQVLLNLLDNACKFTPKNGSIEIRGYPWFWERRYQHVLQSWNGSERRRTVSNQPNAYRVEIRDSGPGVADERLEAMFREYTPCEGKHDRSGGGLGLAICRMILKAHAGEIFAYNSAEGFTFAFVLPFRAKEAPASPPPADWQRASAAWSAVQGRTAR